MKIPMMLSLVTLCACGERKVEPLEQRLGGGDGGGGRSGMLLPIDRCDASSLCYGQLDDQLRLKIDAQPWFEGLDDAAALGVVIVQGDGLSGADPAVDAVWSAIAGTVRLQAGDGAATHLAMVFDGLVVADAEGNEVALASFSAPWGLPR
jgi:hypothetical protein